MDLYGAQGVSIGKDFTDKDWGERVDSISGETHLIQEFCSVPEIKMPVFKGNGVEFETYKYTLGLFLYDEEFKGIYTRASKDNVIASVTGCVTLPNFIFEEKR